MRNPVHAQHRFKNYIKAEIILVEMKSIFDECTFPQSLIQLSQDGPLYIQVIISEKKCYFFL